MNSNKNTQKGLYIKNFGCQMNVYDGDRMQEMMSPYDYGSVNSVEDADLVILNTCHIREKATEKIYSELGRIKKSLAGKGRKTTIAVAGCVAQAEGKELVKRAPIIDLVFGPLTYHHLPEILKSFENDKSKKKKAIIDIEPPDNDKFEKLPKRLKANRNVSSFLSVQEGCDKFCTFCIIPYRRGREVSRKIEEIKLEVEMLVRRGVKEVTLLGQNVDSYGHDLENSPDLADLLTSVNSVDGIERIRFLTSHPNDMSENIIESVHGLEKVCEHINLPFQAGSDSVLERMRRGYSNDEYRSKVSEIRKAIPGVSLSTDVIVGFCGETESDFKETLNLIQDIQFDKVHAAAYSNRAGTIASRNLKDDIPQSEKISRLKALEELQKNISSDINANLVGRTFDVLIEGRKRGRWYGRNRNDKLVYLSDSETIDDLKGETFPVSIEDSGPWSLTGTIIH